MRKAKQVEVPSEGPLPWDTYKELRDHAYNSASYYLTNYGKHSAQVRSKLYEKGYPREESEVLTPKGTVVTRHLVRDALAKLAEEGLVDDDHVIEATIERKLAGGMGFRKIGPELSKAGIPREEYEPFLERYQKSQELSQSLERAYRNALNSFSYKKAATPWERRQKLTQALLRRGFSSDDIAHLTSQEEGDA